MTEPDEAADIAEPNDAAEATENADAADPTDPIERTEPTDPIERNEPFEAIERNESSDQRLSDIGVHAPAVSHAHRTGGANVQRGPLYGANRDVSSSGGGSLLLDLQPLRAVDLDQASRVGRVRGAVVVDAHPVDPVLDLRVARPELGEVAHHDSLTGRGAAADRVARVVGALGTDDGAPVLRRVDRLVRVEGLDRRAAAARVTGPAFVAVMGSAMIRGPASRSIAIAGDRHAAEASRDDQRRDSTANNDPFTHLRLQVPGM